MVSFSLNVIIMATNILDIEEISQYERTLASISVLCMWFKIYDWMRLFPKMAFYCDLIYETIREMKHFLLIFVLCMLMFGSSFFVLNIKRNEGDDIMSNFSPLWTITSFISMYELALGEFEAYKEAETQLYLILMLFFVSSFLIQITFLNMLIAIMADTFDR